MTFQAQIHRTEPQNIGVQFGALSVFQKHFSKRKHQKTPEIYLGPKSLGLFLKNRTPAAERPALREWSIILHLTV